MLLGSSQMNCGLFGFSADRLPNKPDQNREEREMKQHNRVFLGELFYARFEVTNREWALRQASGTDTNETIRIDQKISETNRQGKMLDHLIERFLDLAE